MISENFVLSAAHCVKPGNIPPSIVRLGDHNLRSKDDSSNDIDVEVAEFIQHPEYNSGRKKKDIALIKLVRNVE